MIIPINYDRVPTVFEPTSIVIQHSSDSLINQMSTARFEGGSRRQKIEKSVTTILDACKSYEPGSTVIETQNKKDLGRALQFFSVERPLESQPLELSGGNSDQENNTVQIISPNQFKVLCSALTSPDSKDIIQAIGNYQAQNPGTSSFAITMDKDFRFIVQSTLYNPIGNNYFDGSPIYKSSGARF